MMRAGAIALALFAALPLRAESIDPSEIVLTLQMERTIASLETPEAVITHLTDLMTRIGRPDGLVIATLTEDRNTALESRIAQAVEDLMAVDFSGDDALGRLEVSRGRRDFNATHLQTFFDEFDTDGSGRVTREEVQTGVRLRALEVGSTALLEDIVTWDLNGDGIVTPSEVAAVAQIHRIPKGTLG